MQTFGLQEAADFLLMNKEVLRRKANTVIVPARKVGKRWVFVKEHLADYISGRYPERGQVLRLVDGGLTTNGVKETCQSINEVKRGGYVSQDQTDRIYKDLLGLR